MGFYKISVNKPKKIKANDFVIMKKPTTPLYLKLQIIQDLNSNYQLFHLKKKN